MLVQKKRHPSEIVKQYPKSESIAPNQPPPSGYNGSTIQVIEVTEDDSGYFETTFGELIFSSFLHPTTKPTTDGIVLYTPSYNLLGSQIGDLFSCVQNGPIITVTWGKLATATLATEEIDSLNKYENEINNYIKGIRDSTGALRQLTVPQIPGNVNSGNFVTLTGTFILDPNSPTYVSIINGIDTTSKGTGVVGSSGSLTQGFNESGVSGNVYISWNEKGAYSIPIVTINNYGTLNKLVRASLGKNSSGEKEDVYVFSSSDNTYTIGFTIEELSDGNFEIIINNSSCYLISKSIKCISENKHQYFQ